jgi:hypothetical protein
VHTISVFGRIDSLSKSKSLIDFGPSLLVLFEIHVLRANTMSKKKSAVSYEQQSENWKQTHTPGHPPLTENAWSVDSEYGELSFSNFESAYAYANGLTLGDFNRKIIDKDRRLIEVWLAPEHIHNPDRAKKAQADVAGLPC